MKTMNRLRPECPVSLHEQVRGPDAWGTEFGATVFAQLNLLLLGLGEGTLVPLDYQALERSDVSFQREAVVETLRKHRPRLLFIAIHLTDPDVRENLSLALERRGECLLAREPHGRPTVLGKRLTPEQHATLERVWDGDGITSSDLEKDNVKLSTASSRLAWLWKAGLVERVEGTSSYGGREHRYYAVT